VPTLVASPLHLSESLTPDPSGGLLSPLAMLEHVPMTAYLLRAQGDDFVLEGVNAAGRAKTPALSSMLGRPISLLYADQPQIIADARRCHCERTRVVRETSVRRHERVDGIRQTLVFVSLDAERIVIYAQQSEDVANASAELNEVEERYRSLLASLPEAMLLRGPDGRVLACNDAAARLFGHRQASDLWGRVNLLAEGFRIETAAGQSVVPSESASQRSARNGEVIRGELYRAIDPQGVSRWVRVSAQPIKKADGSVGGSVTLYADETERFEARLAEREAALQLQLALDAGRMGTWQYDPIVDVGDWSKTLDATFRFGDERPGWQGYLERVYPEDRSAASQVLQEMLARPDGTTFEHEHRLVGDDGVIRWAKIRGRVERSGRRLRLLGTAMDVTERRRMQDELLRASRLESLGRLAGGLAHDFNNLLAAMLASIELLSDVCPAAGHEDLTTLRHVTLRARDLTAQLLAFARQQRIELETVELGALVRKVERLLERLVGPTVDLSIETTEPETGGLCVRADAAQLEQVLVNLVINARDAMPEGGRVNVRVRLAPDEAPSPQRVLLEVEDHGNGIDSEHLPHVFDPFFTTKETGTGLGLASSYGVVQTHGGTITVESEPGRGACFRVALPRVLPQARAVHQDGPTFDGRGRVLVVDDDAAVRTSTTRMLRTLGYEVMSAADGDEAEALANQRECRLDFLVCDLAMPNKSGPEVARSIRYIQPGIKVLFVSGYPRGAERQLPADSFLQKPYDRDALARKLAALSRTT
jgi:two-component system, cell cycle sensor histidine kinase and response regulator CckA